MLDAHIVRRSVRTRSGERVILDGLNFTLRSGEIVALVGPSGCGKSTTLRLIAGLDADFDGQFTWSNGSAPRIGSVFQEPRLLPWRTVQQNIDLVRPPDPALAEALLQTLGLWAFRDVYPRALSLGMARRVAIARAFAIEPELLLLDEPFISLDAAMVEQGHRLLLDAWHRRPTTALLVTHDMAEAAALADRILVLTTSPARIRYGVEIPASSRRRGITVGAQVAQEITSAF